MVVFLGIGLVGGTVIGWFWIIWAFFGLSGLLGTDYIHQ
jgi:hypothetical protein